jgi:hypothetical protein
MDNPLASLIPAIISGCFAIAVSLGAIFLSRRSETIQLHESLKAGAYSDFARGIASLAILQKHPVDDQAAALQGRTFMILVADAKARIAIYGGEQPIAGLARFLRAGNVLDSPERTRAFTAICQQFRNDIRRALGKISDADMHFLLFGLELSNYQ